MQLFVDLDGVLADFEAGYEKVFGIRPNKRDGAVDWNAVKNHHGFYRDLPPMPGFHHLWMSIYHLKPIILTGVPRSVEAAHDNKRAWVNKHIGIDQPMISCRSSEKYLHMRNPGDILIDDWEKYMKKWIGAGGIWITHVTADRTIEELNNIMEELNNDNV